MCDRPNCYLGEDECTAALHDEQKSIEYEMAYTSWEASCRTPGLIYENTGEGFCLVERACRRQRGHSNSPHASGYGSGFRQW